MKLFILAAAAAIASASNTFKVNYVASSSRTSYSPDDKVEIQLVRNASGTSVVSEWENLGETFVRGVEKEVLISVDSLTDIPTHLLLRTTGDWNGLNFVTIMMSNDINQTVQFKTDYFDDESPSREPHHSNDIYQYEQVFVTSSGAPVKYAQGKSYVVSWRTGYSVSSGSNSPMYIQFQGSGGNSRFYLLDDVFTSGHVDEVTIGVVEDIGMLQHIKLMAGGPDSWNPINFIEVRTPTRGEVVQFEADKILDQLPPYVDGAGNLVTGTPYYHGFQFVLPAINVEGTGRDPGTQSALEYQATFNTGTTPDAGSSSEQFIQLIGKGTNDPPRSNFVKLGDTFAAGQRTVVDLAIMHDIGELDKIRLRAGGTDSWLVVGDFQVKTPNLALVHYQTDLFMDEKPHDTNNNGTYGAYPVYTEHTLTTPHSEPPNPCTTRGQHNCCGNGICDATEDVGNCAIDCKGSGWASYAWGHMEDPSLTQQAVANHTHEHAAFIQTVRAASTEGHAYFSNISSTVEEITTTTIAQQTTPLPATTAAPSRGTCTVQGRDTPLPDGWTMAGTDNNYCNFCKCSAPSSSVNGQVTCTHKICGMPFQGGEDPVPAGWSTCPAGTVSCHYNSEQDRVSVRSSVQGSGAHRSGQHRCAYNEFSGNCTCYCKMNKIDYAAEEIGTFDFSDTGFDGLSCRSVQFASGGFDPDLGDVTVVISASHSRASASITHDAPAVWVELADATHFMACAREDKKHWRSNDQHGHRLQVEYYAFQTQRRTENNTLVHDTNKPFPGAQGDATLVPAFNNGGVNCRDIAFHTPFDREPLVVGTVDYAADTFVSGTAAVTHWLERVSNERFRVCFRETYHTPTGGNATGDDGMAQFNFNWFAVEDRNAYMTGKYRYSAAGTASSKGHWEKAKNTNGVEVGNDDLGNDVMHACKWLDFGRSFASKPTILVESKHNTVVSGQAVVDWADAPTHPATITYINAVENDRFQLCATTLHRTSAAADNALQWNWLAFGPEYQSSTVH